MRDLKQENSLFFVFFMSSLTLCSVELSMKKVYNLEAWTTDSGEPSNATMAHMFHLTNGRTNRKVK